MKNLVGLIVSILLLIWGFAGLKENLFAVHNLLLMLISCAGITHFGLRGLVKVVFS